MSAGTAAAPRVGGDIIISMENIVKTYYIGQPNELRILHGISMSVREGEFVSIVGQSGSGKSTLMNIIGALDKPTSGRYELSGDDIGECDPDKLSEIRSNKIGFVFQTFNLIPRSNALRNVELPMLYSGASSHERSRRARALLEIVGMGDRVRHLPNELSGGQKQRVAIARAMANDPAIILADEPTGALDTRTGEMVMEIFHRLNRDEGKTIILITHNDKLAMQTQRVLTIADGLIVDEAIPDGARAPAGRAG
jgi:putative ABC transport system ATP-binding protein